MATKAEELIGAWEKYYDLRYNPAQKMAVLKLIAGLPYQFLLDLYNEVIAQVSAQFRTLPDVAAVRKAMLGMNRPEVYLPPERQLEGPLDIDNDEEDRRVWLDLLDQLGIKVEDA